MTRKFTADICDTVLMSNPSPLELLSLSEETFIGKHAWIHVPGVRCNEVIDVYLKAKRKSPENTSACIMVPHMRNTALARRFKHMKVIESYQAGQMLPSAKLTDFASKFKMEVYYDATDSEELHGICKTAANASRRLKMTFHSIVNDKFQAAVLIDSGASHCFMSNTYAKRIGLIVKTKRGHVDCAGDRSTPIEGKTSINLRVQGYNEEVQFLIIDLPSGQDSDMILGESWLEEHDANVDYGKSAVQYLLAGRWSMLKCNKRTARVNKTLKPGGGRDTPSSNVNWIYMAMRVIK